MEQILIQLKFWMLFYLLKFYLPRKWIIKNCKKQNSRVDVLLSLSASVSFFYLLFFASTFIADLFFLPQRYVKAPVWKAEAYTGKLICIATFRMKYVRLLSVMTQELWITKKRWKKKLIHNSKRVFTSNLHPIHSKISPIYFIYIDAGF